MSEMTAGSNIKAKLDRYIGIPYQQRGESFKGCDCYGLVRLFYKYLFGIQLPSYHIIIKGYEDAAMDVELEKWDIVENPEYGDVALWIMPDHSLHMGIMLNVSTVLHNSARVGASVIQRFDILRKWGKFNGFYRHENNTR